jgi:membrane protein DedA with SNARE-associated domain
MEHPFYQLFEEYGIYAVLALCTVEGDITLLLSGVLAHNGYFGPYSFLKVYVAGTLGGMIGDNFGYWVGRLFRTSVKNYRFYEMARPRIERLIDKFGGFSIIVSKYIYGLRVAMCLFNGIGKMPFGRFLLLDFISCSVWVLFLGGVGYFFSGAVTNIIGDFKQIGIAVFFIILGAIIIFYLVEKYLLSQKIEEADSETMHKIEEKLHTLEEKLHLTTSPNREKKDEDETKEESEEKAKAAKE